VTSAILTPHNVNSAPALDAEGFNLITSPFGKTQRIKGSQSNNIAWYVLDGLRTWTQIENTGRMGWRTQSTGLPGNTTGHLIYDLGESFNVSAVEYVGYDESGGSRWPGSYVFYKSDDGVTWTQYTSRTGITNGKGVTITDTAAVTTRYLKLGFTEVAGGNDCVGIMELEVRGLATSQQLSISGSTSFRTWATGGGALTVTRWYDQGSQGKHFDTNTTGSTNFPLTDITLSSVYFDGTTGYRGIASSTGGPITAGNDQFSYGIMWKPTPASTTAQQFVFVTGGSTMVDYQSHGLRFFGSKIQLNFVAPRADSPFSIMLNTMNRTLVTIDDSYLLRPFEVVNNGDTYEMTITSLGTSGNLNIQSNVFFLGHSTYHNDVYDGHINEFILFNNKMSQSQATQIDRMFGKFYPL